MTDEEARDWLADHFSATARQRLERFVALLRSEADRQSLIARSTFADIWSRHIVDSAQLVLLAKRDGPWLDIGSGGGLPGMVIAVLRDAPLVMSEPRRKRAEFLDDTILALELTNARVSHDRVQDICLTNPAVISARAVASIAEIFAWTARMVSRETQFVLPRGRTWRSELAIAEHAWHGLFHVEQSVTDPASGIVIATAVTAR